MASPNRFPRRERIQSRREIGAVFDLGARWSVKGMRLHLRPTGGADNRAVFVTVRKYGNAVRRNRARRVVSECWRLAKGGLNRGYDAVFVIYPGADTFADRNPQVLELLRRAGLGVPSL
ncbi:MAG TPA: ribonuclease P protein component [Spirochaetales bacterium]|nr:ribonuclease P protein component [Spirochaetales bacterium]MBP7263784.1 ribonuclease P protein component [Spirochaetia bacterium]HPE36932.1 ribonuclease P protein component [Spirochaetales bacterium]